MRKQTKLVAVLSAAALLAIGASMTSFAATGWQEENGTWVYYDKNGDVTTDAWAKSGDKWFYLNGDGEMAADSLIDDGTNYFYVNSDGAMVTNSWVAIENENAGDEDEPDAYWYYFQANGKAYKSSGSGSTSFKTINGKKYAFQEDGKMLFGWVDTSSGRMTGDTGWTTATYFCGDENDGAMASGWAKIDVIDPEGEDGIEDQSYWFYFNTSNGKKTDDVDAKSINGKKYAFDGRGVMQSEWYMVATDAEATISNYKYYNSPDQGWRLQKGWVKVVPEETVNPDDYNDDTTRWFYADGSGNIYFSAIKTINSKKYAFNEKGEMLSGLWALNVDSTGKILGSKKIKDSSVKDLIKTADYAGYDVYYFGDSNDGAAKAGNQTVDVDGETFSYSFKTSGAEKYTGLNERKTVFYVKGEKIKADKELRYQAFNASGVAQTLSAVGDIVNSGAYLVNTSGSLMKNKTNIKDADDMYYCTDNNGQVTYYKADKK